MQSSGRFGGGGGGFKGFNRTLVKFKTDCYTKGTVIGKVLDFKRTPALAHLRALQNEY